MLVVVCTFRRLVGRIRLMSLWQTLVKVPRSGTKSFRPLCCSFVFTDAFPHVNAYTYTYVFDISLLTYANSSLGDENSSCSMSPTLSFGRILIASNVSWCTPLSCVIIRGIFEKKEILLNKAHIITSCLYIFHVAWKHIILVSLVWIKLSYLTEYFKYILFYCLLFGGCKRSQYQISSNLSLFLFIPFPLCLPSHRFLFFFK